jgi:hypothetical protein
MIRSGITFVSRNVISHRLSGVSLLAVSNVNNPFGLVGLPYVMWSTHFFVTHIQTEKISSWNGPTVHVCRFMLARASTKIFVSRVRKTAKKIFISHGITVLNFKFFNSHFPVTALGLDLLSGTSQWLRIAHSRGFNRLGVSLPEKKKQSRLLKHWLI